MEDNKEKAGARTPAQTKKEPKTCLPMHHKDTNNSLIVRCVGDSYEVLADTVWISRKREILKDMGVDLKAVPHYFGYTYKPDYLHYEEYPGGWVNMFHPLPVTPKEGEFPTVDKLLEHIFGDMKQKALDYLGICLKYPMQILPVMCLGSPENGTGKTAYANFLKALFGENVGILTQSDLTSQFNGWAKYQHCIFEEITDTKKSQNMIKAVATAKYITVNEKYRQPVSIRSCCHITILTNNLDTFIKAGNEDVRYWVVQVPPIEEFDPDFEEKVRQEIPAFLYYLANTSIRTPKQSRMWFSPEDIETDALQRLRKESRSECAKDIEIWAETVGKNFYTSENDIYEELGRRYSFSQIRKALKQELGMKNPSRRYVDRFGNDHNGRAYFFPCGEDCPS